MERTCNTRSDALTAGGYKDTFQDTAQTVRPRTFFFYYHIGERPPERTETTGAVVGGDTFFGKIALMRTKLHLSNDEVMTRSWIALNLEMADLPWWSPHAKKVIRGQAAIDHLKKYTNKS